MASFHHITSQIISFTYSQHTDFLSNQTHFMECVETFITFYEGNRLIHRSTSFHKSHEHEHVFRCKCIIKVYR